MGIWQEEASFVNAPPLTGEPESKRQHTCTYIDKADGRAEMKASHAPQCSEYFALGREDDAAEAQDGSIVVDNQRKLHRGSHEGEEKARCTEQRVKDKRHQRRRHIARLLRLA